jgi:hypothetical protein
LCSLSSELVRSWDWLAPLACLCCRRAASRRAPETNRCADVGPERRSGAGPQRSHAAELGVRWLRPRGLMKQKIAVLGGILFLAAVGGGRPLLRAALNAGCGNQLLRSVPAPDGRVQAVIFSRSCGATTGFSTQVSLIPSKKSLANESGNVLTADSDHGRAPSGEGGGPQIAIVWEAPDRLVIRHHPAARLFHQARRVGDVTVRYEPTAPAGESVAAPDAPRR